jgi:hypothetical protein
MELLWGESRLRKYRSQQTFTDRHKHELPLALLIFGQDFEKTFKIHRESCG